MFRFVEDSIIVEVKIKVFERQMYCHKKLDSCKLINLLHLIDA